MKKIFTAFILSLFLLSPFYVTAQTNPRITHIYTDYNGFWSSGEGAINTIRPDNSHNLLGFRFNGITYATGVDNTKLVARGIGFVNTNFQAFPVKDIPLKDGSSLFFGFGQMYDGINNGTAFPPPFTLPGQISHILKRGKNGLDLGTAVTNIPSTSQALTFVFRAIFDPNQIGDGIPDILVTQVAQPNSNFDEVYFEDINGNLIGNKVLINFNENTLAPAVGSWNVDFFNPIAGTEGIKNTFRDIRLWARDASAFGINMQNYKQVYQLRYKLAGSSDPAFLAYNTAFIKILAAYGDEAQTNVDESVSIPYLANDIYQPGTIINTNITTNPTHGSVSINANNTFTYTPNPNYTGTDSFIYEICDPNGTCDQATVNIVIGLADLSITKTVDKVTPQTGENVVFTLRVKNLGPQNATAVTLNDLMPSGFTYVSHSPSSAAYLNETGNLFISNMPNQGEYQLQITARVNDSGNYLNTAGVTGAKYDPNTDNNTASVQVKPMPKATISGGGAVCTGTPLPDVIFKNYGQAPWTLSYSYNGTATTVSNLTSPTYTITNAAVGTYSLIKITDANGVSANLSGSVSVAQVSVPQVKITQPTCSNPKGSLEVISPLGTDYEYQLQTTTSGNTQSGNFQASPVFSNLIAGNSVQYKIVVRLKNLISCSSNSMSMSIPELVQAQISVSDVICNNGVSVAANSVDQTSGNTYLWTITGGTFSTPATNATVNFLPASNTAQVTLHLKLTSSTGCVSEVTKQITVSQPSLGGTINSSKNLICPGQSMTLNLTNQRGKIISWQQKTINGSIWTEIPHQGTSYTTPALQNSMQYRVVVGNNPCSTAFSTVYTVAVVEDFVINESLTDGTYCLHTPVNALSIDNGVAEKGYTYQWYVSEYDINIGGTPVVGATDAFFTPSGDEAGIKYYYVVKTRECLSKPSDPAQIIIKELIQANAGPDQSLNKRYFTLSANIGSDHEGRWEVVSVLRDAIALDTSSVIIDDSNNPQTTVTTLSNSITTLRWTLDNGSCTSSDEVILISRTLPAQTNPILLNQAQKNTKR